MEHNQLVQIPYGAFSKAEYLVSYLSLLQEPFFAFRSLNQGSQQSGKTGKLLTEKPVSLAKYCH